MSSMSTVMLSLTVALIALLALATPADSHRIAAAPLPARAGVYLDDYHPVSLEPYNAALATKYYSWHIHCYFFQTDANQTATAADLRDRFLTAFNVSACSGECDTYCPSICHWDLNTVPRGPHPIGSWGIYLPLEHFTAAVEFMTVHSAGLIVLFHPNSGYPIVDHMERGLWLHQKLPLIASALEPYIPPVDSATD